ncbi:hypothetical protein ES689_08805 [Frigoribacterium sp. ACAM 257]|uniref:hypothetical protein n=1 Tax=Frigoribacterium sp. ACAM 257 TaxID=2508998 RepID=UPI0011B96BE7|nr:hypothetical protein [Frigoribacterium sp. ACAM 257]TWX38702.1 hypothetical protein ES689_08805 [Frigoribacterium sp. ACAM 257]
MAAFMLKAADLESRLSAARGRYAETGAALGSYADSLASALDDSRPAVRDNDRARDDFDAADRLVTTYEGRALLEPEGPAKQQYEDWAAAQEVRRREARDRMTTSARRLAAAHAAADAAAVVAIRRIDDATDDGLRDSFWDDLGGVAHAVGAAVGDVGDGIADAWDASALRDVLAPGFESFQDWMQENDAWIARVLEVVDRVGMIVGVLSMAFPCLGPVALALALLSIGITAARALAGTATILDVGLSALSLITFGTGRILAKSARSSLVGLRTARAQALMDDGMSTSLAQATVAKTFYRSRPRMFDSSLFFAGGDATAAHLSIYLVRGRPGVSAAELQHAAELAGRVKALQALAWAGQAQGAAPDVWSVMTDLRGLLPLGQSRALTGAAW